jgi:hypothetical protein
VLDVARQETTLEARRRELTLKIAEGRQVVAALSTRRHVIEQKIEEAAEGIQRLENQVAAIDTVIGIVASQDIAFQPPRPAAPVLEVVAASTVDGAETLARPQPFKPVAYLKCVADGHEWMNSRSVPGAVTCRRCRARRKA